MRLALRVLGWDRNIGWDSDCRGDFEEELGKRGNYVGLIAFLGGGGELCCYDWCFLFVLGLELRTGVGVGGKRMHSEMSGCEIGICVNGRVSIHIEVYIFSQRLEMHASKGSQL